MNKQEQGVAITQVIGELKKFYSEVNGLAGLITSKIHSELKIQLKQGKKLKIDMQDDVEIIESYGEDESAWEWTSLSVPVYQHSSRKAKEDNICFYLNIQLSFAGSSVANISPALPQIHIGIDDRPIGEDDYFYTFPISKSEQEANFINIEQSSLLKFNYNSRNYWQYSIKLLSVNAANLEELIIFPIVQLLNEDTWNIKADSALDKALIRYENENLVFKD